MNCYTRSSAIVLSVLASFEIAGCASDCNAHRGPADDAHQAAAPLAAPVYIDEIGLTIWIPNEANADSPTGSDVYLVIDYKPVSSTYARRGEVRDWSTQQLSYGKNIFSGCGVPKDFGRDSRGGFTIVNGFSQNGKDFKVQRAQVVGSRTENGVETFWRLAKKDYGPAGVWVRDHQGHTEYPALVIDSLESWEQVDNLHPEWR